MKNKHFNCVAVIPAAGVGSRMKADRPKQYLNIHGKTVLEHTLDKISKLPFISHIVVAISREDDYFAKAMLPDSRFVTCIGGAERADTVKNALEVLKVHSPSWVMVHDAARPLVDINDIETLFQTCLAHDEGGILASRVKDTIKCGDLHIESTVPREHLWQALTPQLFPFQLLHDSLSSALESGACITDEASAIELTNSPVRLVPGRSDNIKITTPEDLELARFLMQNIRGTHD